MAIYYTYQHAAAWEAAEKRGYLFGDPEYAVFQDEELALYRPAYDWLAGQYEKRTGQSLAGAYPVWLSDTIPDVGRGGYLEPGEPGVVLTVDLPDLSVLAIEAGYWNFAVNRWFLTFEDREATSEEELQTSWEKMFDQDWCEAVVEEYPETNTKYYYLVNRIEVGQVLDVTTFIEEGATL
ncbi:DUF3841 domain-containing protein [Exiguobacterium sp. SH4S7]|uniref:DUF3841 domain-containing protein n=1 Tax=Exiguobacterium sp. SH4S7 TaxID=2510958 RepID=UPI00103E83B7|nr:DUF3841 domain-containing protein [Exiguobacterium sp. SH4S7]TCI34087.1 DUF3841 domain-containing protein [Exiguobacterium sp. SH4S7]